MSEVMEKPITDRKVEAEDSPAAMMPASIRVPTILGMTLKEAQMSTRWGSSRFGLRLSTATEARFRYSRNTTVHTAAQAPARKVTCSLLAIRFRPACQGDTATVTSQISPMVTAYITAPKASLAPVPGMFPW